MDLFEELRALVDALRVAEIDYALCGAVALAIHGLPRATRDIDLMTRPQDLHALREVVRRLGYTIEALPMTFSGSGICMHRFTKLGASPSEPLMLDVLLAQPPIDAVFETRDTIALEGGSAWVVSRAGLITLKLAAGRPQDLADVRRLEELGDA